MKTKRVAYRGFTLVELLIVVVVIAILAVISIVAYNGLQDRGRTSKINTDLAALNRAIIIARNHTGKTLWQITNSAGPTSDGCGGKASGTDLAALPKSDVCWTRYQSALDAISNASNMDVRNLLDPWGRPYNIYENEGRTTPTSCTKDMISTYQYPHVQWGSTASTRIFLSNTLSGC